MILTFVKKNAGREEYDDFEDHELVVVHADRLDHAHEIVELRNKLAELQKVGEVRVDHVRLGEQDAAAGGGSSCSGLLMHARIGHVVHGLVAYVEQEQVTPGVLQEQYLILLQRGRERGQITRPLDDLVQAQVGHVQEGGEQVGIVERKEGRHTATTTTAANTSRRRAYRCELIAAVAVAAAVTGATIIVLGGVCGGSEGVLFVVALEHVVYGGYFAYELGHDGLVGHLEGVGELHAAVDVLDVAALDGLAAARQVKASALVGRAAAAMPVLAYRVHAHARLETLGEATGRTPLAIERGDVALDVAARVAREHLLVLHGALEEALARLARERAVVEAADLVAAYRTRAARRRLFE